MVLHQTPCKKQIAPGTFFPANHLV